MIIILIKCIIILFLSYISIMFFIGGVKILLCDKFQYEANHRLSGGLLNTLKGTLPYNKHNKNLHHGLAWDIKNKKIIKQSSLSDETMNKILK